MSFQVVLDPEHAAPVLARLPPQPKRRLKEALRLLGRDPLGVDGDLDVKELRVQAPLAPAYRLRLGTWRVVYLLRGRRVLVMRIFPRRDGYGWLERHG